MGQPIINLQERLPKLSFNNASLRGILDFIGTSAGINITYEASYVDRAYTHQSRGRHRRAGAAADHDGQQPVLQGGQPEDHHGDPRHRAEPRQVRRHRRPRLLHLSRGRGGNRADHQLDDAYLDDAGAAAGAAEQDGEHHHRPRHGAGRRDHRADHPRQRQAAGRGGDRRPDPRGEPAARQASRAEPQRIRPRPDLLAGGGAAKHIRDVPRRPIRRRSISTRSARASARPTST